MGRKHIVEEVGLKGEDKADYREKWRLKNRARKRQREREEGIKVALLPYLEQV